MRPEDVIEAACRYRAGASLATVAAPHHAVGTSLEFEVTVEAVRHRVPATIVKTPFFNPARKTAPIA